MQGTEGSVEMLKSGISVTLDMLLTKLTDILPTVLDIGVQIITSLK